MDADRIRLVLNLSIILGIVAVVAMICAAIVVRMVIEKAGNAASLLDVLFRQGSLLQILVATIVIAAAILLRILDLINSEAAVSLLSATAGYILGGLPLRTTKIPDVTGTPSSP